MLLGIVMDAMQSICEIHYVVDWRLLFVGAGAEEWVLKQM
jgi:hypothetical protein